MLNKRSLYSRFPWLRPNDQAVDVIIGDDLDAALSAALFLQAHPNARLVGIYSQYASVYLSTACTWQQALDAVWLDLDIYAAPCRSLGHHILRWDARQKLPGLHNSLNLNDLWGKAVARDFGGKYPLGTVHFLMWLYGKEIPALPNADLLLWLADSSYINAQSQSWRKRGGTWQRRRGFRLNVKSWLNGAIQLPSLQRTFEQVDTLAFEERMRAFQQVMQAYALERGEGQVASHYLKLFGYQCQPVGEPGAYMLHLLEFITRQTGWTVAPRQLEPLRQLHVKSGVRANVKADRIGTGGLANFLESHNVFSYVFTHLDTVNYTVMETVE